MNRFNVAHGVSTVALAIALITGPSLAYADSPGGKVQGVGARVNRWFRRRAVKNAEYKVAEAQKKLAQEKAEHEVSERMRRLASPDPRATTLAKRRLSPAELIRWKASIAALDVAKHNLEWKKHVLNFADHKDFEIVYAAKSYRHDVGVEGFRVGASAFSLGALGFVSVALAGVDNPLAVFLVPPIMFTLGRTEQAAERYRAARREAQKSTMDEMINQL